MLPSQTLLRFRRIGTITIIAVYLVILMGGIVRATGAGMGCPDWPTCFGQWIPPTEEAQLPSNYHEIYAARGYENTQFNPVKTWTEYVNRLVGATTGLLVLLTVWFSRFFLKTDKAIFFLSLTVFVLISFQGWLGAAVVASNLKPYMITLHMLMALLIVALLIYVIARAQKDSLSQLDIHQLGQHFDHFLIIAMMMTLLQVAMGTQVREAVDLIAHEHNYIDRIYWRDSFPIIFYVHRSFSAIILFFHLWLARKVYLILDKRNIVFIAMMVLIGFLGMTIVAGISMDRLGMPPVAQPIHLLLASLIFGLQFFLFICSRYSKDNNELTPV